MKYLEMTLGQRKRSRTLVRAPRVAMNVAILSATICTGAMINVERADAAAVPDISQSWLINNYTDQVWSAGEFHKQQGENISGISFGGSTGHTALSPGGIYFVDYHADDWWSTTKSYTWGRVCYRGRWWNLRRDDPRFSWKDVYIFALDDGHGGKRLIANPEGAHQDIPLVATNAC